MAGLVRAKATADQLDKLAARLVQIDRDLMGVCCEHPNPLTLRATDELAAIHRKLRWLRHLIEIEAGRC